MAHPLTLDIPDEVYQPLLTSAQQAGRSPEELATVWLTEAVRHRQGDPLLRWAGAFASDVTDVAERHDDYLGEALLKELRGEEDG